jgi:hypothetical protein
VKEQGGGGAYTRACSVTTAVWCLRSVLPTSSCRISPRRLHPCWGHVDLRWRAGSGVGLGGVGLAAFYASPLRQHAGDQDARISDFRRWGRVTGQHAVSLQWCGILGPVLLVHASSGPRRLHPCSGHVFWGWQADSVVGWSSLGQRLVTSEHDNQGYSGGGVGWGGA